MTDEKTFRPTGEHFSEVTAKLVEYMTSDQLTAAADDMDMMGKDEPERIFYGILASMMRECAAQSERP